MRTKHKSVVGALDGTGKQKCTKCNHQSIAGLLQGKGKCPYHWAEGNWGKAWASRCYPTHKEAELLSL